jgi:N-acetylglutamate synthase-like GNAT family acetyltransferase
MLHRDTEQRIDGFIAVSQTGEDLFRPLVALQASGPEVAVDLLAGTLAPHRPYRIIAPIELAQAMEATLDVTRSTVNRVYQLDEARFRPIVNVLVQRVTNADGAPRFQIESQGKLVAMAGTNWRSPTFAEVFVYVHPRARGRGWGKSVVSACTAELLEERLQPLYIVAEGNETSMRLADAVGYVDTRGREFDAECQLRLPESGQASTKVQRQQRDG